MQKFARCVDPVVAPAAAVAAAADAELEAADMLDLLCMNGFTAGSTAIGFRLAEARALLTDA